MLLNGRKPTLNTRRATAAVADGGSPTFFARYVAGPNSIAASIVQGIGGGRALQTTSLREADSLVAGHQERERPALFPFQARLATRGVVRRLLPRNTVEPMADLRVTHGYKMLRRGPSGQSVEGPAVARFFQPRPAGAKPPRGQGGAQPAGRFNTGDESWHAA